MIDTHVHLYDADYDGDFEQVVARAKDAGVTKCIMPGIDSSYFERMLDCSLKLSGFAFPAIGLHPTSVNMNWKEELAFVERYLDDPRFCAIGEIGLDGYWSREFIEAQMDVLKIQLIWSCQKHLPVIIHCREATNEIFTVLESLRSEGYCVRGVFHAFSGSYETYCRILSMGDFKVGIGGVVTYKNAAIASTIQKIPLSDILLETDAPWLSPVPCRGKRNESSNLIYIVDKIAALKGCSASEVMDVTEKNALTLFNI